MPDWTGFRGGNRFEEAGADAAASQMTAITSGAANTKGAYVQLVAASAFRAVGFFVKIHNIAGSLSDRLVDIAVGAGGSEQDILSNLIYSGRGETDFPNIYFPIPIPEGTRVSARHQAIAINNLLEVQLHLVGLPFIYSSPLGRATTYGAATGDSGGVGVDPGGVANTKGAYSQIVASTTNHISQLYMGIGNQNNSAMVIRNTLVDIAVGAGGSEQIIIPDIYHQATTRENVLTPFVGPFPVNIPAATRLAVRAQCDIIDAADRLLDVVLYGLD